MPWGDGRSRGCEVGGRRPYFCASVVAVRDLVPALDVLRLARTRADVPRGGPHEPAEPLLLQDVCAPSGDPGTGEHRGEHVRWYLGEVEDHRRPELDVGFEDAVRPPLAQLRQRRP